MKNLQYKPLIQHPAGTIYNLLKECYGDLSNIRPDFVKKWKPDWREYDRSIFNFPDTVGACGFISYLSQKIVGFASWDPRKFPAGVIGHNCLLSRYRGFGYGIQQINEIIKRFREMKFKKAIVSTMDLEFFFPAQKMYLACGFKKTRRFIDQNEDCYIVEYKLSLENKTKKDEQEEF